MNDPVLKDVNDALKCVIDISNRSLSKEERNDSISEFSSIIKSYSELLNHHELCCAAVDEVASALQSEKSDLDQFNASQLFKDKLKDLQVSHQKKNYCQELENLLHVSPEDCDVEVTGSNVPSVQLDPFSQMPIENPGKSVKCNHLFEYKTIMRMFNHLKGKKQTLKCPHIGCMSVLTKEDIEKV